MSKAPWLVTGAGVAALGAVLLTTRPAGVEASTHPTPRPGVTAAKVVPQSLVPRTPGAEQAYAAARAAAATLDGVYCYCDCSKHAGHRSLLTCFEGEHGAYCDVCMGEAILAAEMTARGQSLMDIRAAIDQQFGS